MNWPAFLSASAAVLVAGVLGLLIYETRALLNQRRVPPITDIVRRAEQTHTRWTTVAYFVAGGLVGWFVAHMGMF
jgi:hypothetical protein